MPTTKTIDDTDALVQTELSHRDRHGTEVDQGRIEELRHKGFRPEDAPRIERLERTLDLPAEKRELQRVWASARLRADPSLRKDVLAQLVHQVATDQATAYEALLRLKDLEVVAEDCDFARFVEPQHTGNRFVCYVEGVPEFVVEYRSPVWPDGDPTARVIDAEKASALPD